MAFQAIFKINACMHALYQATTVIHWLHCTWHRVVGWWWLMGWGRGVSVNIPGLISYTIMAYACKGWGMISEHFSDEILSWHMPAGAEEWSRNTSVMKDWALVEKRRDTSRMQFERVITRIGFRCTENVSPSKCPECLKLRHDRWFSIPSQITVISPHHTSNNLYSWWNSLSILWTDHLKVSSCTHISPITQIPLHLPL
jgi:hypothetical protein